MQTPKIFEPITGGIVNPDTIKQWLSALVPSGANSRELFTLPSATWLTSVQSMLKGSDTLRHMQLDAIHNTQKRTSQLANSLAHATNPADASTAWQQFSQDNLQNTIEYWSAYREIVQGTEIEMLDHVQKTISKGAKEEAPQARLMKPVRRRSTAKNATKSRAQRKVSARH